MVGVARPVAGRRLIVAVELTSNATCRAHSVKASARAQTTGAGSYEIKQIFGDDNQVCVVGKVTAERFVGSPYLRGAERPTPRLSAACTASRTETCRSGPNRRGASPRR